MLVDLAVLIADGGAAIADIDVLRHQGEVSGPVASDTTVWRMLDELDDVRLRRIAAARAEVRVRLWQLFGGPPAAKAAGRDIGTGVVVLDIDSTIVLVQPRLRRIWLYEGFATWSEWIWSEHLGHKSAASWFKTLYNTPAQDTAFWTPPPCDPGTPAYLFTGTYYRGALTLQALREKVGDGAFFRTLRAWAAEHRYGTATTPQFIALAERENGQDLDHFFDVWLYQDAKPTSW